ncbi:MAG TPA: hypothetical protein VGF55_33240 [Gemmataceae bacterium]|jgi:hypothetical protein
MPPTIPDDDGEVNLYNLANSSVFTPRVYFVNGIRVLPRTHAVTAAYLSLLIERPVWGVYNATAGLYVGSVVDLVQCLLDYTQNAGARLTSRNNLNKPPAVPEGDIPRFLEDVDRKYVVWNKATLTLFKELVRNRHEEQFVIAHSQGNLITSNALFVLEDVLGSAGLEKIRVYSLASPAPAWPLGLRKTYGGGGRQDNAFMNDLVALLRPHNLAKKVGVGAFQNAGDFRTYPQSGPVALAPHDANRIIDTLNFLKSIRGDLGLPKEFKPEFLPDSAKAALAAFPP